MYHRSKPLRLQTDVAPRLGSKDDGVVGGHRKLRSKQDFDLAGIRRSAKRSAIWDCGTGLNLRAAVQAKGQGDAGNKKASRRQSDHLSGPEVHIRTIISRSDQKAPSQSAQRYADRV